MTSVPSWVAGGIPEHYERHLVPAIFEPYAEELAARVAASGARAVLELACGTGVVTRRLLDHRPALERIVATDVSPAMIEFARARTPADARLEWHAADAGALPFADASFDTVACQFGVMFFADKLAGYREARRLLSAGGRYHFKVWDAFEHNPFGRIAHQTIKSFLPGDARPCYLTPFTYHDAAVVEDELRQAGFRSVRIERVAKLGHAPTALEFATGLVRGNPVAQTIAEYGLDRLAIEQALAVALAYECGDRPLRSPMRALVVEADA